MPALPPGEMQEIHDEVVAETQKALEEEGITLVYLAKKLKEELNAEETKFFQNHGEVKEERNVIAWDVRQRGRMDAHKLLGHYPADKLDVGVNKPILIITKPSNGGPDDGESGAGSLP